MKLLINESEILFFLTEISKSFLSEADSEYLASITFDQHRIEETIQDIQKKINDGKLQKFLRKIPGRIEYAVKEDLKDYYTKIADFLTSKRKERKELIETKLNSIISRIGEEKLISLYQQNTEVHGFVKSLGNCLSNDYTIARRTSYVETGEDCILRNTIKNENLLVAKIANNYPFWFVDSGYTNFIETNKKWHRIVRNHLHNGILFEAPVDRLENFKTFPKNWRTSGDKILVIEPGQFSANVFNVDINQWKYNVEQELRQYTDKQIIFREKESKKKRVPLYNHLLDEDYYCVININSNAATEAVWAGIPIITLDRHITNPISRNKISDINDLLRPNIANWLCMLSYSQFTVEELASGTAFTLIKQYNGNS